jgi:hypothetical protein
MNMGMCSYEVQEQSCLSVAVLEEWQKINVIVMIIIIFSNIKNISMLGILFFVFNNRESLLFAPNKWCKYFLYWKLI